MINSKLYLSSAFALLLFTSMTGQSAAETVRQFSPPEVLKKIHVPLPAWLAARPQSYPNSVDTLEYNAERAARFRKLLQHVLDGDWEKARSMASVSKYQILALIEESGWYVVLIDEDFRGLGPTIAVSPFPRRNLIAEAPHSKFERGTAEQAGLFVTELGARAAILSGAHRCAARRETTCSGKTSVCGTNERAPYKDSDVAHNPSTLFHVAHEVLTSRWPNAVVFNLHGFRKRKTAPETWIIISNGGRANVQGEKVLSKRLRNRIRKNVGGIETRAVSCNDATDVEFNYPRLCGFTNVQGRHLNGSADICLESTESASGRFIHIEQTWDVLGEINRGWGNLTMHPAGKAVLDAVEKEIPCMLARCP